MGERERRGGRGGGEAAAGAGGGGGEAAADACGRVTRQAHGPPVCERKREERCHVGWVTWTKPDDVDQNRVVSVREGNLHGFEELRV